MLLKAFDCSLEKLNLSFEMNNRPKAKSLNYKKKRENFALGLGKNFLGHKKSEPLTAK